MSGSKRPLTDLLTSSTHPSKKPKFDLRNPSLIPTAPSPTDDEPNPELAADVIGNTHNHQQHHKRGAVNIDGFDSDSDGGDNFDVRAAQKSKNSNGKGKSKDEEDADMFADLEEDFADGGGGGSDDEGKGGKKKKDVRFLNNDQIEGQVRSSRAGGHVGNRLKLTDEEARYMEKHGRLPASAAIEANGGDNEDGSSSESEADDETRAALDEEIDAELGAGAKTKHAPKLDAFNMRDEQDEGAFDESGNYVRRRGDPDAVHDRWMEGVGKKEMRRAKEAMEKREEERRRKDREEDQVNLGEKLAELIKLMGKGETVLEALARVGVKGNSKRKEEVEAITAAANLIMSRGNPEVYDAERELLIRQYTRETGEQWTDPKKETQWEYRWTDARDGGNVNGPYDSQTMRSWNDAGYFGEGVEFRPVGDDEWSCVADFL